MRQGAWKLILNDGTSPQLFDLSKDLSEKNNLATLEPARVAALTQSWQNWQNQMPPIPKPQKNAPKKAPVE